MILDKLYKHRKEKCPKCKKLMERKEIMISMGGYVANICDKCKLQHRLPIVKGVPPIVQAHFPMDRSGYKEVE